MKTLNRTSAIKYTFNSKSGALPKFMQGPQSHDEIVGTVNMFIAFNQSAQRDTQGMDLAAKINYYNEKSFYVISEVK